MLGSVQQWTRYPSAMHDPRMTRPYSIHIPRITRVQGVHPVASSYTLSIQYLRRIHRRTSLL